MSKSTTVEELAKAVGRATRSARFCASGLLNVVDPGIEVEGLGAVKLPLKPAMKKKLVASCDAAPYGKGTRTLVDTQVRNTFELDPKKFRLSSAWNAAVAEALGPVAEQLGLPADRLEARLYKLLVYEKGGFFLPHRDSEKHDRMVASLIVVLPNSFQGGALVVRHGPVEQVLRFEEAADGKAPCYAAFFADCEHEVQRVSYGVRVCLAYNLVLKPRRGKPKADDDATPDASADALADSIGSWIAQQPAKPLVFAMEHHYTERGLSVDLLKGGDRRLAELVAAAEKADCLVHLAQVSRHLSQFADDGSFARGYSRGYRESRHPIEIGETYEDELSATQWADLEGAKQPWGDVALDLAAIVSSTPIDDWKPTSEEFEGYTGNEGNTLDRWYHRSAILLWHRDHHFDVVASAGAAESMPLFSSMAASLSKTPKKRLEQLRSDCIRFARAIIARWPRDYSGHWGRPPRKESPLDEFPNQLLTLHDRDAIALFLSKMAEQDPSLSLKSFVTAACRDFGWGAFAPELKRLLASESDARDRREIPVRDVEWLSAFCLDKAADPDKSALARELCATAVERFCEPRPPRSLYERRWEAPASETSLPYLLQALMAIGRDEDLARVIQFVQESPDEFRMDECLAPTLRSLIPWARKRLGSVPPQLAGWLESVRRRLESATAARPEPPADWARKANLACNCPCCAQLKAFLIDPEKEVARIPAREDLRQHLIDMIDNHRFDVKHALECKGRPYSLVLTKTSASFERALKRFETDRMLLGELPVAE